MLRVSINEIVMACRRECVVDLGSWPPCVIIHPKFFSGDRPRVSIRKLIYEAAREFDYSWFSLSFPPLSYESLPEDELISYSDFRSCEDCEEALNEGGWYFVACREELNLSPSDLSGTSRNCKSASEFLLKSGAQLLVSAEPDESAWMIAVSQEEV